MPSASVMILRCVGLLVARRLMAARPHQARSVASRRSGSRQTRTSLGLPTCLGSGLSLYTFEGRRTASFSTWIQAKARPVVRSRNERLELPLRLHLLSSAVRVQPVWRPGTLRSTSRQRAQRRRLGRYAQAGRRTLPAQGIAHLFPCRRSPRHAGRLRIPGSRTDQVCDPLSANQVLQDRIGYLLKRPVGRPPNEVRRFHANFSYQAGSWTKPRRVVAKVEWHPGELYPRVGFIVTNMSRPAERVVAFYNKRGTCEQWIKEGKVRSSGRDCHAGRSQPTPSASSFMRWPTISVTSCARWRRPNRLRTGR